MDIKRFKLTLTDTNGLVYDQWIITNDAADPEADFIYPMTRFGSQDLAATITRTIENRRTI